MSYQIKSVSFHLLAEQLLGSKETHVDVVLSKDVKLLSTTLAEGLGEVVVRALGALVGSAVGLEVRGALDVSSGGHVGGVAVCGEG